MGMHRSVGDSWCRLSRLQRDGLGAVLFAAAVLFEVLWVADLKGPAPAVLAQSLALAGATALRRRAPMVAVAAGAAAGATNPLIYSGSDFDFLLTQVWAVILLVYSVAAYARRWTLAVAGAVLFLFVFWIDNQRQVSEPVDYLASLVCVAAPWLAGWTARQARLQAQRLQAANTQLAEQRQQAEIAAADAERLRIARELHDIVAHSLTVVALQADAADALLPDRPESAQRAVVTIRVTAQEALQEMRRLLGLLRPVDPEQTEPLHGLQDVPTLVSVAGAGSGAVGLNIEGERVTLTPAVDQVAYRIVQEGLTNARRHGDGDTCRVTVRYTPDAVELDIWNSADTAAVAEQGFGLIGVRERVRAVGGQLTAGPEKERAWALRARLPLGPPLR